MYKNKEVFDMKKFLSSLAVVGVCSSSLYGYGLNSADTNVYLSGSFWSGDAYYLTENIDPAKDAVEHDGTFDAVGLSMSVRPKALSSVVTHAYANAQYITITPNEDDIDPTTEHYALFTELGIGFGLPPLNRALNDIKTRPYIGFAWGEVLDSSNKFNDFSNANYSASVGLLVNPIENININLEYKGYINSNTSLHGAYISLGIGF
jgi:hypothetical protein